MAKQSRKQRMKNLSRLLSLAVVGLAASGVVQIRQDGILTGAELIGWAFLSLALLLGFTWPTRCRVETSRHTACRNDAYGFLFGCRGYGHWKEKFLIRIRFRHGKMKPVQLREPAAAQAFMYQPVPQSQPVKVIVEDNARSKFLFWIAVISMIAGIAQTVIAVTIH
jgi:hypothetical protein